jgi:glutaredoxin
MNMENGIIVYGNTWCGGTRRVRSFLERNKVPYHWVDIDSDQQAALLVEGMNNGMRSVPTIVWQDGSKLVEPSEKELAEKLGIKLVP